MECWILFPLLLTHLLLVCAADTLNADTQVNAGNVSAINECYWSGEGPVCEGKCRAGETVASESKKNDGNGCIIGKKLYCCKGAASSSNTTEEVAAPHHVKRQPQVENQVTNSSTGQLPPGDTKEDCYWVGKSPNCKGSCLEGDYMVNTSRTANGSTCIVGKKKYCCTGTNQTLTKSDGAYSSSTAEPPTRTSVKQMTSGNSSCYWVGKPPICLGSCRFGDYVAEKSPTGDDGEKCESGQKKFCCARRQSIGPVSTEEPPHATRDNGQIGNNQVNNSISNSTIRPFQAWRRPTPRGSPINSTVNNRVKIVKIKRKLAMSTPTTETLSTSETWSTLAMTSLLTLPSTTASTTASTTTSTIASTTTTTTASTTTSTIASTTTTESTPIPTTSATWSTLTATESTSMKPTTSASRKFTPFFDLPDVLPVPLIFRIHKSDETDATETPANSTATSIIQSPTTSATPTTSKC